MACLFIVLFVTRSGSTYLIDGLRTHPGIYAEYENLIELIPRGPGGQVDGVRRFYEYFSMGAHEAVGFKAKWRDILDLHAFGALLEELGVSVIHLDRRNVVKLVISLMRGEILHASTGDWNLYVPTNRQPAMAIDVKRFGRLLDSVERERDYLLRFVRHLRVPLLSLDYEDLLLSYNLTSARVIEFLGCRPAALSPPTLKHTHGDLRRVILNLDELREMYQRTVYEPLFEEMACDGLTEPDGG